MKELNIKLKIENVLWSGNHKFRENINCEMKWKQSIVKYLKGVLKCLHVSTDYNNTGTYFGTSYSLLKTPTNPKITYFQDIWCEVWPMWPGVVTSWSSDEDYGLYLSSWLFSVCHVWPASTGIIMSVNTSSNYIINLNPILSVGFYDVTTGKPKNNI